MDLSSPHIEKSLLLVLENQNQGYEKIYKLFNQKRKSACLDTEIPRSAFVVSTMQHPEVLEFSSLQNLPNHDFIWATYWILLKRFPQSKEVMVWEKVAQKHQKSTFQKRLIISVCQSFEGRLKRANWIKEKNTKEETSIYSLDESLRNPVPMWRSQNFFRMLLYKGLDFLYLVYRFTFRPVKQGVKNFSQRRRKK